MKKHILLILLLPVIMIGQEFCGVEYLPHKFASDKHLLKNKNAQEKEYNPFFYGTTQNGENYEIPVVVHVIESTDPENAKWAVTDEEIKEWINMTNRIYATTNGNGYYTESEGGTVMPFKLSLAQRTIDGKPTTGILRYNGSTLTDYDKWGVVIRLKDAINQDGSTPTNIGKVYQEHIRELAKPWDTSLYYNIYVVIGIDGVKDRGWLSAVAGYPEFPNYLYNTIIKAVFVKTENNSTLAHEIGHSLGLIHPFDGAKRDDEKNCPKDNNCNTDNDKVCDTEPVYLDYVNKVVGQTAIVPTNNEINPCTGKNYNDTQYNIMVYTYEPKKFTVGQRDRALKEFLRYRSSLVKSRGAEPITNDSEVNLSPAGCKPNRVEFNNNFGTGITRVKINTLDNSSGTKDGFYIDYTKDAWRNKTLFTKLNKGENTLTVTTGSNKSNQYLKIWIDYNNNNQFENSEMIANKSFKGANQTFTFNFTPPEDAIKDTFVRLRIKVDEIFFTIQGACEDPISGQVEDYAVKMVSEKTPEPVIPPTENSDTYNGRVGINTDKPQTTLDIRETKITPLPQGVSFPNFTTEQREKFDKTKIKEGTMIYNTTLKCLEIFINGNWNCIK